MAGCEILDYVHPMPPAMPTLLDSLSRRHVLIGGLMAGLAGCSRDAKDGSDHPDRAFTEPQIPPGLSPQFFPPAGFVWSGLKVDRLPEARYGVASPPVNPRAHLLILADATYPAEVYFGLAQAALSEGVAVWILEPPGQGGAGKYLLQNQKVHTPDFIHSIKVAEALIRDFIKPSAERPLFVFAQGSGALTALRLSLSPDVTSGVVIYAPWLGEAAPEQTVWSRDDAPTDDWGRIAFRWQIANPDLRLKVKSESWLSEANKALKNIKTISLDKLNPKAARPPMLILAAETDVGSTRSLCSGRGPCRSEAVTGYEGLKARLLDFLARPAA